MKRILTLALLVLCLSGCGAPAPAETAPPTESPQSTPAPEVPAGLYDPEASLAMDPTGAIRCYDLGKLSPAAVRLMGGDPVLFTTGDVTTLIKLSGEDRHIAATAQLPGPLSAGAPGTQVNAKGITYYDAQARALVFLNTSLEEVNRVSLPEALLGDPVLSQDRKLLYYATADSLRVIDLGTKLDRLLLQTTYDRLAPTALHLGDTLLECCAREGDAEFNLYLRTGTGETLATAGAALTLSSNEELYFARLETMRYTELLTGTPEKGPFTLETRDYQPDTIPVMALNSLLTAAPAAGGTGLDLYDLRMGDRTASLTLPTALDCLSAAGDPATGQLWLVCSDGRKNLLLSWDPQLSPVEDDSVYRLPRRTEEAPDTAGLAECADKARELGDAYGIDIHIWQEAAAACPENYQLQPEYRVPLIRHCLNEVEALLARYPQGFFSQLTTGEARLQLHLTGEITGLAEGLTPAAPLGVQFWDEAGVPHVAVTLQDSLASPLTRELFHIIDSRVLSACSRYDQWNQLNPEGFRYDHSYLHTPGDMDSQWTSGESRAFIDTGSMSFPREDRARIMEYAMKEDCAGYFASETMQQKLRTLCLGIREAFGLEKAPQNFPWEQYLTEPLAYKA